MTQDTLIVELVLAMSNEEILDKMRVMRAARQTKGIRHIACCISDFCDDPRELWAIPEVRALCRRLVTTGFVAYLDDHTTPLPKRPVADHLRKSAGALEIWMWGEGEMRANGAFLYSPRLRADFAAALTRANETADAALGPLREPR